MHLPQHPHWVYLCIQLGIFKSCFSFPVPLRKVLAANSLMLKSVLQAPLYKFMAVPAHGHLSTWLIQTSIAESKLIFKISSLTFPFCTQEPLSVDEMNVFACPSAKQLFWSSTITTVSSWHIIALYPGVEHRPSTMCCHLFHPNDVARAQ